MKKVALQLEASSSSSSGSMFGGFQMIGGHQGSQEAFADHFAVELLKLGIDVIERAQLDKVMREQALNLGGVTDSTAQTIAVGKILAVDALIIGTVGTGQNYSYGFMGFGGGIREVVSSASIRIIDVEKGNWMLIITLSGGSDSIRDTAESFAKALKQKLEAT
ncbi:MAG: CsgG/HfaB family protein [Nitrospirales bacterium]